MLKNKIFKISTVSILLSQAFSVMFSSGVAAADVTRNLEAGVYGKGVASYNEAPDDFYYEESHLNAYGAYHFDNQNQIKLDIGVRSQDEGVGDYKYDVFIDEAYYKYTENKISSFSIGRFLNPVGLYGKSKYDYSKHPFSVEGNVVSSVDGAEIAYLGELQRGVYFDLKAFVGTTLSEQKIDGLDVDLDTRLNYGANVKIAGPAGSLNFGIYASNNGEDIEINDVKVVDETSLFYQSNIGYEFSQNNLYFLAEYNHTVLNYDDSEDNQKDQFDAMIAYKVGNFMPMFGYTYENKDNFFRLGEEESNTVKAGFRYTFNEYISILTEYNYAMYQTAQEDNQEVIFGLTFNY